MTGPIRWFIWRRLLRLQSKQQSCARRCERTARRLRLYGKWNWRLSILLQEFNVDVCREDGRLWDCGKRTYPPSLQLYSHQASVVFSHLPLANVKYQWRIAFNSYTLPTTINVSTELKLQKLSNILSLTRFAGRKRGSRPVTTEEGYLAWANICSGRVNLQDLSSIIDR